MLTNNKIKKTDSSANNTTFLGKMSVFSVFFRTFAARN